MFDLHLELLEVITNDKLAYWLGLCISEIIDDLAQLVDKTDGRIKNETHRVKLLDAKSASCGECFASVEQL